MKGDKFDPYQPDNVPLFEALYGKNLISLGGSVAIDNMFAGLALKGLKALDIGFGLGGVAFYLAEKYHMDIAGIEIYPWMVVYAKLHTPEALSHSLQFSTYTKSGQLPYAPSSFDMVYSKGVFNHIDDKVSLFQQINAVLKPNGLLVIADWIFPKKVTDLTQALVCETKESYEQVLNETGFSDIEFRDDSQLFLVYAEELLVNLTNHEEVMKEKYGKELLLTIEKQYKELIEKIKLQQTIAVRIVAKKII